MATIAAHSGFIVGAKDEALDKRSTIRALAGIAGASSSAPDVIRAVPWRAVVFGLAFMALASGCASGTDLTRHDGAITGAKQGAGVAFALGGSVMDENRPNSFAVGVTVTLVTLPVFALVGAATGALSVRKP